MESALFHIQQELSQLTPDKPTVTAVLLLFWRQSSNIIGGNGSSLETLVESTAGTLMAKYICTAGLEVQSFLGLGDPLKARWNRVSENPCLKCSGFTDNIRMCSRIQHISFVYLYLFNAYYAQYLALWEVKIKTQSLLCNQGVRFNTLRLK